MKQNINNQTVQRRCEPQMDKHFIQSQGIAQRKPAPKTGGNGNLPAQLKDGVENLSGIDMSDVKVHYNSDKPAQLQAHAYAQGTDIHLASGQEKHLPHEAWHVVQQKQGRVQPTTQMKGVNVNDNSSLETEADVMGAKALGSASSPAQLKKTGDSVPSQTVVQKVGDPPTGKDLGDMATGVFDRLPTGASPKIQQVYGMPGMQGLRQQPTGLRAGWEYGKRETELLGTLSTVGDTRADTLARSYPASMFRPLAGALGGGYLSAKHKIGQWFK